MEDKVIFEFMRDGESLLLDDTLFAVTDYGGIEATEYELVTEENVNSDGERKKRRKVLPREVRVEFDYLPWRDVSTVRQRLIRFFSPYSGGTLAVTYLGVKRSVDYELESFKIINKNIYEELSCLVYVRCLDPSFKSPDVISAPIMTLVGGWRWRFSLPFRMKQYGALKKNIYNNGHMETPVEIYFRGPAEDPRVENHRAGQYIQVDRSLTSDETLYISTMYGDLKVEIQTWTASGTVREDAWDLLDPGSAFFRLQPGDNMVEYHSGGVRSKGVEIYYRERFLGV